MPQPVIGAITFVVVTQGEQGGRQSRPQLAPEPIQVSASLSLSLWSAALPTFSVPAGVLAGSCPASDTRTHVRVHAHGLALIHLVSTMGTAPLETGNWGARDEEEGVGRGGGMCAHLWGECLSSPGHRLFDVETGLGSPDIDRSVFPVLPASVPHMPLKKIGPMCMCHSQLLFPLPLFDTSGHSTTPLHMHALSH